MGNPRQGAAPWSPFIGGAAQIGTGWTGADHSACHVPLAGKGRGTRRGIRITDDSLRHSMMMHAREAYRALGGTDAERIGKSIPARPNPFAELERQFATG